MLWPNEGLGGDVRKPWPETALTCWPVESFKAAGINFATWNIRIEGDVQVVQDILITYYLSFTQQLSSLVHVTKSDFSYSVFAMGLVPGQAEHLHGSPGKDPTRTGIRERKKDFSENES